MSFEIKGLEELRDSLEKMAETAKNIEGQHTFQEMFPNSFMKKYTKFDTIENLFDAYCIPKTQEEFESFPQEQMDHIIQQSTSFDSWQSMLDTAAQELFLLKLDL